jgi:hypothetical protein
MKDVGKFYVHLIYFAAIFLWLVGKICGYFGMFFPFWYAVPRKIWQP